MKLVELLARNWAVWPAGQAVEQTSLGYVFCRTKGRNLMFGTHEIAEDQDTAVVTRPQWQEERDRMKAMEAPKDARTTPEMIAAWKAAQGKAMPIEQIPEPTYEQQLWDRVASSAIGGIVASSAFHNYQSFQGNVANAVDFASQIADVFMAERAKRVGK